jgi:hypothetical protein
MFARVSTYQGSPDKVDEGIRNWREKVFPVIRKQLEEAGIKDRGSLFLVDRKSGKSISVSLWETEEDMRASEKQADQARSELATGVGGEIVSVERYEVAIDERT